MRISPMARLGSSGCSNAIAKTLPETWSPLANTSPPAEKQTFGNFSNRSFATSSTAPFPTPQKSSLDSTKKSKSRNSGEGCASVSKTSLPDAKTGSEAYPQEVSNGSIRASKYHPDSFRIFSQKSQNRRNSFDTRTVFQRFSFAFQTSDPGRNLEKRFSKFRISRKKSEMAASASRISPFWQFTVISSVVQSARMFVRTLSMPLLGRSLRTYVSEGDEKTFVGKGRSAHAAESFDFGELFSDDLLYFDRKTVYPFRVHRQGVRDGLDGKPRDGTVTVGQGHSNDDSVSSDRRHERSVCLVRTVGVRYRNRLSRRRSRGPSASVRRGRLNVGTASAEDDGAGGGDGDFFVHGRCFPGIAPMIRRRVRESSPYSRKLRKKRPNERSYGVEVSGIEGDAHLKALVRADFHIQTSPLLCRLYEGVRLVSLERRFAQADAGRLFDFVEGCRRDDVALADFPEPYRLGIHRFEDRFGFRLEPLERRGKGERKDEPVLVAIVKRRSDRDNGKRERRLFSKRPPRDRHGYEKKERHGEKRRFLWQVRSDELSSKVDEGRDV